jgi:magnesium chelatase family protein
MLSRVHSVAFAGLEAILVEVEVDVTLGGDKIVFVTVGLPDTAVKESKERVLAAIKNSGYRIEALSCTINLAPGDLRKEGPLYDLPIALALLRSIKAVEFEAIFPYLIVGEIGLSGELRPICGSLAAALLARNLGKKGILLPAANAQEASTVPGIEVIPIKNLNEAVKFLKNRSSIIPLSQKTSSDVFKHHPILVDFKDIKGQAHVKRAMEIAAAGGHNVVLTGPPGSGKSMIAKATIGIMPELTIEEALETTKIHSIAGLLPEGKSLITERPFRSPHHTVSYAGLIGGGTNPRPGEVSLAHNGILFLDELPEFSRMTLEVLRQPLEDRKVTISRANGNYIFPTNIMCIAAMNPCPCGHLGNPEKNCKDTETQISRYRNKISGPFWDRMDMRIEVPALKYQDMVKEGDSESSSQVRERIRLARQRQYERYKTIKINSQMTAQEIKKFCPLSADCRDVMRQAIENMNLSARTFDRLLRVALTISDLDGDTGIKKAHLMEAITFHGNK